MEGRDGYSGLLLFKMLLLGMWNGLSDYGVEELVNDSLSASAFCNLALEDDVPDHSILSCFRSYMTKCSAFDQLLLNINTQLKARYVGLEKMHTQHVLEFIAYNLQRMPNLATKQKCCV